MMKVLCGVQLFNKKKNVLTRMLCVQDLVDKVAKHDVFDLPMF